MRLTASAARRFAAVIALTSIAAPVGATTVLKFSDEELVRHAARIIEGTVQSVTSTWNAEHTQIHTSVHIGVAASYKGEVAAGQILTLTLLGGRVGNDVMTFVGAPVFHAGENVIVFVDGDPNAMIPVVGLFQGKLTVETDTQTGGRTVQGRNQSRDAFVTQVRNLVTQQAKEANER